MQSLTDDQKKERLEQIYGSFKGKFAAVPDVTADEVAILAEEGAVIVDVRNSVEQEVSMIPGAITSRDFEAGADEHQGKTVICYCTAGYRSGHYADKLRRKGWEVRNFAGSILAWTHAGKPLTGPQGETRRVHVASPQWSLEADGYEPVW